jgi:hypothetical protein
MPRNSTGKYSLPIGNPVTTGTVIESEWANTTMDDMATAMSDALDTGGTNGMKAPFKLYDGVVGAPGLAFTLEPSTGWFRKSTNVVGFAVNGVQMMEIGPTYIAGIEPTLPESFSTKAYVDLVATTLESMFNGGGDALNSQITAVNARVDALVAELAVTNANVAANGTAIAALQARCDSLEARMAAAEGRLGTHDADLANLNANKASLNADVRFNTVTAAGDIVAYS